MSKRRTANLLRKRISQLNDRIDILISTSKTHLPTFKKLMSEHLEAKTSLDKISYRR